MRWASLLLLVGCYGPTLQPGRPCSEDGSCPGNQVCDPSQAPPTCVDRLGDAGVLDGEPDAPPDVPPVQCDDGCPVEQPFCDLGSGTCRGCIADAECASDVCHELTGACVAETAALYVSPNGTGTTCTRMAPCGSIEEADSQVTAMRRTIKVADGTYSDRFELKPRNGVTSVVVSGADRTWDGATISATQGSNKIQLDLTAVIEGISLVSTDQDGIDSQGTVTLSHVLVRSSRDSGVVGRGPLTRILDSRIELSSASGVLLQNGTGEIERTVITNNSNGGLRVESGAGFSVINTIIASNGAPTNGLGGVRVFGSGPVGAPAVFRFNTVARNRSQFGVSPGFDSGRPVTIESSILANQPGVLASDISAMCTAQSSLFEDGAPAGNITGDPMFVSASDFHVLPGSAAKDAAPALNVPAVDVDGHPRSGVPDIGADELP